MKKKIIDLLKSRDSESFLLGCKLLEESGFFEKVKKYSQDTFELVNVGTLIQNCQDAINGFKYISWDGGIKAICFRKDGIDHWSSQRTFYNFVKAYYELV